MTPSVPAHPQSRLRRVSGRCLDGLAGAIESYFDIAVALIVACYFGVGACYALRPFWYDELFTVYLCRLPDLQTIWAALKSGADFNPPFFYAVTRIFHAAFGESPPAALRIPGMLGVLLMCFCVGRFVSRRCGKLFGLMAALLPFLTLAWAYAAEARPYGMVLGFTGAALLSWQHFLESRRPTAAVLFALSLLGAVQSHAFAVFVLLPFAFAEAVRNLKRRRVDPTIGACILLAAASAAVYLPLAANAAKFTLQPGHIFAPSVVSLFASYATLFQNLLWPLVIAGIVAALVSRADQNRECCHDSGRPRLPACEIACLAAFLLLPAFTTAFAAFRHGGYLPRYGLSAVIGASALLPIGFHRATGGNRRAVALTLCTFFGWWLATSLPVIGLMGPEPVSRLKPLDFKAIGSELPIVMSNGLTFLEADYREPAATAGRLVFLVDNQAAVALTGGDGQDRIYDTLLKWFPIRGTVVGYREFLSTHRKFLVYGPFENSLDWLIPKLQKDQVRLTLKGRYAGYSVLLEAETEPAAASAGEGR